MPHVNSSGGGEDLASTDEVKVYDDEGEEEQRSSENLSEDKLGLVTETEEGKTSDIEGPNFAGSEKSGGPEGKTPEPVPDRLPGPFGYPFLTPYPFHNGAGLGKVLSPPPPGLSYFYDHFSQPPPAHMGIPPVHMDPKTGLPRHMYPLPHPSQFPSHLYSPDLSQMQWNGAPSYPITSAALRPPYSTSPLSGSPLSRFSPTGLLPHHMSHPCLPHPAIVTPGPKQELSLHAGGGGGASENHRSRPSLSLHSPHHYYPDVYGNGVGPAPSPPSSHPEQKRPPKIKKPLNAFMLFMKEMRQTVIEECTLKESAAINQILGRRWHALDRSEQAKYYEMARKEKELHMQLYPGWSARDNYATHNKKALKKRKRDGPGPVQPGSMMSMHHGPPGSIPPPGITSLPNPGIIQDGQYLYDDFSTSSGDCPNAKKCRARFGLDAQNQWCKPCRRKKKCIRFMGDDDDDDDDCDDCEGGACSSSTLGSNTDLEDCSSPRLPPLQPSEAASSPVAPRPPVRPHPYSAASLLAPCTSSSSPQQQQPLATRLPPSNPPSAVLAAT